MSAKDQERGARCSVRGKGSSEVGSDEVCFSARMAWLWEPIKDGRRQVRRSGTCPNLVVPLTAPHQVNASCICM